MQTLKRKLISICTSYVAAQPSAQPRGNGRSEAPVLIKINRTRVAERGAMCTFPVPARSCSGEIFRKVISRLSSLTTGAKSRTNSTNGISFKTCCYFMIYIINTFMSVSHWDVIITYKYNLKVSIQNFFLFLFFFFGWNDLYLITKLTRVC